MKKFVFALISLITLMGFTTIGALANENENFICVETGIELEYAVNNYSKGNNIRLSKDIEMQKDLNIQRSVIIDLDGHKIEFDSPANSVNIGRARSVYAIYSVYVQDPGYSQQRGRFINDYGNLVETGLQRCVGDMIYYFSRYSYSPRVNVFEYSEYDHKEYLDDINVEFINGDIIAKSIDDSAKNRKSKINGQDAIKVISGEITLNCMNVKAANGTNGVNGQDAKLGRVMNTKAKKGIKGANGGTGVVVKRGSLYVIDSNIYGGDGGNGGNGGNSYIKQKDRRLSRSLIGKLGKAGKAGSAYSLAKGAGFNSYGNCSMVDGKDGKDGIDGVQY